MASYLVKLITAMAFDYGTKRIGVAIGQTISLTAEPLQVIQMKNKQATWDEINYLVKEWAPDVFVLGYPTTADKSPHFLIPKIEKFSRQLSSRYRKEVNFVDERLSSHATVDYALEVRKIGLDAVAAKLILETWLSELEV
ncbi:MAG: Holliday junction resolvase RuvX [Proteobacteria bacterium]|jgi:putative holliday junction resolvase|nr:Holliday junction resolvase RuvX [Pseudomonadota bacterium]